MKSLHDAYISGLGSYSPGKPVPFENIEDVLGHITEAPPKTLKWIERMRPFFGELLGIDYCHYALDPVTREPTDDNITMSVKSATVALERAGLDPQDVDLIVYGSNIMENVSPPTSTLIQEELKIRHCAEYSIHSNCTCIYKAIQLASDMVANGRYKNALVITSQVSSAFLRSEHFNQDVVGKSELILRWFLCDGAGALVITSDPPKDRQTFRVVDTYLESAGVGLGPDMYCVHGGHRINPLEAYEKGWHHLSQNFTKVSKLATKLAKQALENMVDKTGLDLSKAKYMFSNVPTRHLSDRVIRTLKEEMNLDQLSFFSSIANRGYAGPPAILMSLDEFTQTNKPDNGDIMFSMVTESSKWMHGGFILECVN